MNYHNRLSEHLRINLLSIFICLQFFSFGQDVELLTQADVDAFDQSTTEINGSLILGQNLIANDIQDLTPLSNISSVYGSLLIRECHLLTNVDALENIVSINGTFAIVSNSNLANIGGLDNLSINQGGIYIARNQSLKSINGFNNTDSISTVQIQENENLQSIIGLNNISSLSENLIIASHPNLVDFQCLGNLISVGEDITISGNEKLETTISLSKLTRVCGSFKIMSNPKFQHFDVFDELSSIKENLEISNNGLLENLDWLSKIDSVGHLTISDNISLINIEGLNNLSIIESITISNNDNLKNIDGLAGFQSAESITISDNMNLKNIDGFEHVITLNKITIANNTSLLNFNGLSSLTSVNVSIDIRSNPSLISLTGFESLTSFSGIFYIRGNSKIKNLDGLDNLVDAVGGIEISGNNKLDNFDGLGPITSIGFLVIRDNKSLKNLDALIGLNSTGNLSIEWNDHLSNIHGLKNISSIEGNLSIKYNCILYYCCGIRELLESNAVEGNIDISSNAMGCRTQDDILETECNEKHIILVCQADVDSFDQELQEVEGDLVVSGNDITNLNSLSNLKEIGDNLIIKSCDSLLTVDGFENIGKINGELQIESNVSLKAINGFANVRNVGSLEISSNPLLEEFSGFEKMTAVLGSVTIGLNDQLTKINGLINLDSIVGRVAIFRNDQLETLDDLSGLRFLLSNFEVFNNDKLRHIDGLSVTPTLVRGSIIIASNPALRHLNGLTDMIIRCNDNNACGIRVSGNGKLTDCCGLQTFRYRNWGWFNFVDVYQNPSPCSSEEEVRDFECFHNVKGSVFYDYNRNKLKDSLEYGIPGVALTINNEIVRTNASGDYQDYVEDAVNIISLSTPAGYELTTDSSSFTFSFDTFNITKKQFGLYNSAQEFSSELSISSEPTRCNTGVELYVKVLNNGFIPSTGEVKLSLDSHLSFVSSSINFQEQDNYLVYQFDTLYPFQYLKFTMVLDMPSEEFTGETITVSGEVYYDEPSGLVVKDETTYESIVLCSYDPNDKQVSPVGIKDENYTLKDSELQYTVRFQNTGNAAAIDVTILDTLSGHLDLETFKVVNSSFPAFTTLNDLAVEFFFQDIWLIDSLTNEPESHGFISYSIKPKADLPEETEIENTAHIIFDFNPAIVTNTTKNTLVENLPSCPVSVAEVASPYIRVYPNPFSNKVNVRLSTGNISSINVYDVHGRNIKLPSAGNFEYTLDVESLKPGIYILEIITNDGYEIVEKIIKK